MIPARPSRLRPAALALAVLPLGLPLAARAEAPPSAAVIEAYADLAAATFGDALAGAQALDAAIAAFLAAPSEATQQAARDAWIAARVPYLQSEAFRFGNPLVDAWEGRVNAWPLDEGLIDYVDPDSAAVNEENPLALADIIANPRPQIGGAVVDAGRITPEFLAGTLQEAEGIEANVATGYHAIEFLLWGQDLNGTEAGAGARPHTDYLQGAGCTHGNCDRRADYLRAASALLVADLAEMAANWSGGGAARAALAQDGAAGVGAILRGIGSLSYGELAGERIKLGLMLHDPEEEQDCFSDQTHNSHYYDGLGIRNVYLGTYRRADGSAVSGPSISDLVAARAPEVDAQLRRELDASVAALDAIRQAGEAGTRYDQLIGIGNEAGKAMITAAVDALVAQTRSIERAVAALGQSVEVEGSDSLDNPGAVFR